MYKIKSGICYRNLCEYFWLIKDAEGHANWMEQVVLPGSWFMPQADYRWPAEQQFLNNFMSNIVQFADGL